MDNRIKYYEELYYNLVTQVLWALTWNEARDLQILLSHKDFEVLFEETKKLLKKEPKREQVTFYGIRVVEVHSRDKPKIVRIL